MVELMTEDAMKAQHDQDATEQVMLAEDELDADLEAWMPQDFDHFGDFGASRMAEGAE